MPKRPRTPRSPIGSALFAIWLLTGCIPGNTYTYEAVQQEYAAAFRGIRPLESDIADSRTGEINLPVSLADAVRTALVNNPDTRMALFRIQQAEAGIAGVSARFYPTFRFYTDVTQGDAPSAYLFKTIDQRKLPESVDFNDPGGFRNYESGLTAQWNLYNGGRDMLDRRMAESDRSIEILDRSGVDNRLVAGVIDAYFTVLAAGDFVRIARKSVDTVQSQLRVMGVRYAGGGALKSDILSLEVRLAQAHEAVIRHDNHRQIAMAALGNLMGIGPEKEFMLGDAEMKQPELPGAYLEGLVYAMDHRPEVRKAREQAVRSKMALDRAMAGYLPRLDVVGRYYMDDPSMGYDTDRDNWTLALMLNWDLFNGFSTAADKQRAESMLAEMLAADRKTVLAVKTDVKTAYLNTQAAAARLAVAEKSVVSAAETLKLVTLQYEGGSATVTRYLEAELAHSTTQISATAARFDRERAKADLGRALGYWTTASSDTLKENGGP